MKETNIKFWEHTNQINETTNIQILNISSTN